MLLMKVIPLKLIEVGLEQAMTAALLSHGLSTGLLSRVGIVKFVPDALCFLLMLIIGLVIRG